jgi:ATP-binding cassette, subfamily G (WHITE), eye pigment precursor transporter
MRQVVALDGERDEVGVQRAQLLKDEWASKVTATKNTNRMTPPGNALLDATASDDSYEDTRLGPEGQLVVLMHRNFLRLVRDRIAFQVGIFQSLFMALIFGLIYLQLELDQKGIQNFTGAFFVVIVNQTFASASPLFVGVPTELPMILREYRAGLYRLAVWFVSKNISELPV